MFAIYYSLGRIDTLVWLYYLYHYIENSDCADKNVVWKGDSDMVNNNIILKILSFFWAILKPILIALAIIAASFMVSCFIYFVADLISGRRLKKPKGLVYVKPKKITLFRKIFLDTPRQLISDIFDKEPGFFPYQGCVVFTGRQGAGKTVALVQFMRAMQNTFPCCQVITNLGYRYENAVLDDWRPLITYKNGIYGVIAAIDEMQNWFSSNQSKDFPPEMLQVITQNRKNRRIILGTSQVFIRLAKPLREQVTEVRECHTFFGCITLVVRKEPFLKADGDVDHYKYRGFYCFVHDQDLRDSYDTYRVIDSLAKSGFQPRNENVVTINQFVSNGNKFARKK